jgi:hypothetical protein
MSPAGVGQGVDMMSILTRKSLVTKITKYLLFPFC